MSKIVHNVVNDEIIIIDFTEAELAQIKSEAAENQKKIEQMLIENQNKAAAKAALLEKLGITEEEAKLLLS